MPTCFSDLAPNQLCTYIYSEEEFQDVRIAIRRTDDYLQDMYSLNNHPLSSFLISGETIRRRCAFVKPMETLFIDPADYPELFL